MEDGCPIHGLKLPPLHEPPTLTQPHNTIDCPQPFIKALVAMACKCPLLLLLPAIPQAFRVRFQHPAAAAWLPSRHTCEPYIIRPDFLYRPISLSCRIVCLLGGLSNNLPSFWASQDVFPAAVCVSSTSSSKHLVPSFLDNHALSAGSLDFQCMYSGSLDDLISDLNALRISGSPTCSNADLMVC